MYALDIKGTHHVILREGPLILLLYLYYYQYIFSFLIKKGTHHLSGEWS